MSEEALQEMLDHREFIAWVIPPRQLRAWAE
jgi:hypothetical protein